MPTDHDPEELGVPAPLWTRRAVQQLIRNEFAIAMPVRTVGSLVSKPAPFLLPGDVFRTALDRFSQAAQETLPVVDNSEDRRIIGYLSEAYALRRYAHELERHRGGRQDDAGIFSPASGDLRSVTTK